MEKRNLRIHISVDERVMLNDCIDFVIHCLYTDRLIPKDKTDKFQLITKFEVLSNTINNGEVIQDDLLQSKN